MDENSQLRNPGKVAPVERWAKQGNLRGGLFPYNQPEKDIYAGLGKPASAPENTPGPGGILSPQQQTGATNGQSQRAVAGAGPTDSGGATGGRANIGSAAGVPGGEGRVTGAVGRPEDEFMPGTKAVFNEGRKDIAAALDQGKYTKAAFTGLRQLATYPVALADDVVGGAVRGAYGLLRNPAEDAGRAVLGMEDRKEPVPVAAAPTQASSSAQPNVPGADATMPGQDPGRAAATQQPTTPKLVQGADGRQYLPEAVSQDDRLRSDAMIKQAFSRDTKRVTGQDSNQGDLEFNRNGMNDGINTLRSEPAALDTANKAWAMRGAGVKASLDSKGGLVLSDSTGPEKMRYTDRQGNPTSQYENTAQFDNGQKQLAAASASLRNPDGTKWSENDNAVMAANMRDGVSQYAGTSRAPAPSQMSPLRARLEAMGGQKMNKNQVAALLSLRSADQQHEVSMAQTAAGIKREQMQNDTQRDTNAATVASAREGHLLNYSATTENNQRTIEAAKLAAQREKFYKDRDFEAGRKDKALEQTQSAEKAWTEHANTMFRTKDDKGNSVPDANKAAAYTQFVDQGISLMIPRLEKGTPEQRAYAARLKTEGRAALDAEDKGELPVLFGRQQAHAATTGSGPFSSGGASSMDPQDYRVVGSDNGWFQDRVKTRGGQTIPETNLRYGPDANRLFWNSGQGSTHLLPNKLRGE